MTTTLRPAGPEEPGDVASPGTSRSRRYDICVNGRRAGGLHVTAADEHGLRTGRIAAIEVDEPDRHRGRATVAALAAEELLRGWGCVRLALAVPAAAQPALRLAAALGYTELARHLLTELHPHGPPAVPPDGVRLRPMTDDHFREWSARDLTQLAAALTADGAAPERAALDAERAQRALLPDGPDTPGMSFHQLLHEDSAVGVLWLRLDGAPRPDADAWVYAVEVDAEQRGRGHGRTLMRAAEDVCREAGARVLGLNVHSGNTPARKLYASLGYRPVEHHLAKPLL
ncbi:GNAT family N-acetyltransferase [Streptomyces sp. RKND-216]|uniref:GNAT family N-acetyltransferase n=1 Tax=Streptomyces sp. RKND-216 TaxID=2562581 RepID=UPI00109D8BA5|nr:GNAT family N-acetyltransferase [Streptomyces sp. RKND-216]THA27303.1 GNAT family N-acetyltransferase [Streptomyces sp. RKND-216]